MGISAAVVAVTAVGSAGIAVKGQMDVKKEAKRQRKEQEDLAAEAKIEQDKQEEIVAAEAIRTKSKIKARKVRSAGGGGLLTTGDLGLMGKQTLGA